MTTFGMQSVEGSPTASDLFPTGCTALAPDERKAVLLMAARGVVEKYVDIETHSHTLLLLPMTTQMKESTIMKCKMTRCRHTHVIL